MPLPGMARAQARAAPLVRIEGAMASERSLVQVRVVPATPEDWPWMRQRYEHTAWDSLPEAQRRLVSRREVRAHVRAQVAGFRERQGDTLQGFVARDPGGRRAGFVWVEVSRHAFTGEPRAYVVELYVSHAFRRQGVGRTLMEAAEAWALEHGLHRIALNVAAHNTAARNLYESLGYQVDALRMSKSLAP